MTHDDELTAVVVRVIRVMPRSSVPAHLDALRQVMPELPATLEPGDEHIVQAEGDPRDPNGMRYVFVTRLPVEADDLEGLTYH